MLTRWPTQRSAARTGQLGRAAQRPGVAPPLPMASRGRHCCQPCGVLSCVIYTREVAGSLRRYLVSAAVGYRGNNFGPHCHERETVRPSGRSMRADGVLCTRSCRAAFDCSGEGWRLQPAIGPRCDPRRRGESQLSCELSRSNVSVASGSTPGVKLATMSTSSVTSCSRATSSGDRIVRGHKRTDAAPVAPNTMRRSSALPTRGSKVNERAEDRGVNGLEPCARK